MRKGFYLYEGNTYVLINPVRPIVLSRITPEGLLRNIQIQEEDENDLIYLGNTEKQKQDTFIAINEGNEYQSCALGKALIYCEQELGKIAANVKKSYEASTSKTERTLKDLIVQEVCSSALFKAVELSKDRNIASTLLSFWSGQLLLNNSYTEKDDIDDVKDYKDFRELLKIRFSLQEDTQRKEHIYANFCCFVYRLLNDLSRS